MHHFRFHVGDYLTHTAHLTPMEDLAYRRILDHYYLHEQPLTGSPQHIARLIRLPDCADDVRQVLDEFFDCDPDGPTWLQKRVDKEIAGYRSLCESGRKAAKKRWDTQGSTESMGNPSETQSDGNADPILTSNQYPITNNQKSKGRFTPPTLSEVRAYCLEKGYTVDPERFWNFYESKGWMVGKSKMKKWKSALANWDKDDAKKRAKPADISGKRSSRDVTLNELLTDRSWAE